MANDLAEGLAELRPEVKVLIVTHPENLEQLAALSTQYDVAFVAEAFPDIEGASALEVARRLARRVVWMKALSNDHQTDLSDVEMLDWPFTADALAQLSRRLIDASEPSPR